MLNSLCVMEVLNPNSWASPQRTLIVYSLFACFVEAGFGNFTPFSARRSGPHNAICIAVYKCFLYYYYYYSFSKDESRMAKCDLRWKMLPLVI